jgi:hypothetical protein
LYNAVRDNDVDAIRRILACDVHWSAFP